MAGGPSAPAPGVLSVWVVSDGRAGIENQALGVAEAVARRRPAAVTVKRLRWRPWLRRLPTRLALVPRWLLDPSSDPLAPPWPDLWIGNGRASAPFSIAMRRWSGGRTLVVQLQDPLRDPRLFDVVAPPAHDGLAGPNVFPLLGAPHRIDAAALPAAAAARPELQVLPRPRVALLVGGRSRAFDLPEAAAAAIAASVAAAVAREAGSVLVTVSRRTPGPAKAALRAGLAHLPGLLWDPDAPDGTANPYPALLGAADHVLVTADSINMVAEAAATGLPVQIVPVPGGQARKDRFHAALAERGIARPFAGALERFSYPPLRETERLADQLIESLDGRGPKAAVG